MIYYLELKKILPNLNKFKQNGKLNWILIIHQA